MSFVPRFNVICDLLLNPSTAECSVHTRPMIFFVHQRQQTGGVLSGWTSLCTAPRVSNSSQQLSSRRYSMSATGNPATWLRSSLERYITVLWSRLCHDWFIWLPVLLWLVDGITLLVSGLLMQSISFYWFSDSSWRVGHCKRFFSQ